MIKSLWIFIILMSLNTFAQGRVNQFSSLSSPEKGWIITHPFKANKAFYISKDVLIITDSILKTNLLDKDINGGRLDAFKHSYWLVRLSQEIGKKSAIKLGEAHEKGNFQTYKKMQMEDGLVPDKIATTMDLFNNEVGANIAKINKGLTNQKMIQLVIDEINKGSMRIIKKDGIGNYLTCDDQLINLQSIKGKWENDKCLVPSNKNKRD